MTWITPSDLLLLAFLLLRGVYEAPLTISMISFVNRRCALTLFHVQRQGPSITSPAFLVAASICGHGGLACSAAQRFQAWCATTWVST